MAAIPGAAAGPPAVPAPPVLPTTFTEWYGNKPDPYGDPAQLLQPFRAEPHLLEGTCTSMTTTTYPLPLLVNGQDGLPHVVLMPFNENTLPGQPMGSKYGLVGDVSNTGALPALIVIPRTWFQLSSYQAVPAVNQMTGLWNVRYANELHLAPATIGVDGATNIRTRSARTDRPTDPNHPSGGTHNGAPRMSS